MSYSKEEVVKVLSRVRYPGKNEDIIALKMVEDILIEGDRISFSLIFDKSNDPFISSVKKACVKTLNKYLDKLAINKDHITVKARQMVGKNEFLKGVKNIIAVASGKGGVGKSTVACNLAVALAKKEYKVGLIDADIYGPSIPKMLGIEGQRTTVKKVNEQEMIVPVESYRVKLLSIGFFVDPGDPVIWRGPMATNALRQFLGQTDWGQLDYMLVDLPPGTSDVHITMVQEVPVTGAIVITTPQNIALADALKGVNMFRSTQINVPVLGLVENMAWFTPDELPENKYFIFGKDGGLNLANRLNVPLLGQIPIVQSICEDGDLGRPSILNENTTVSKAFIDLAERVIVEIKNRNKNIAPTERVKITKH